MADGTRIDELVRALDDDASPAHLDFTPAVIELGAIGIEAIPALLGALDAPSEDTRLHAQRAVETIIYRRHGFVPGQGFPSNEADAEASAELGRIGYDFEAPPAERDAAIARLRDWLDTAR